MTRHYICVEDALENIKEIIETIKRTPGLDEDFLRGLAGDLAARETFLRDPYNWVKEKEEEK